MRDAATNREQIDILRQRATAWNKYLTENRDVPIDLYGADLRGAVLDKASFSNGLLRAADLRGASLRKAFFSDADLQGANLSGADLRGAYLGGAKLGSATFAETNFGEAKLVYYTINDSN